MHHPHKVSYAGSNPVITTSKLRTALAQSGEHYTVTVEVTGSKPVRCAKFTNQSLICLVVMSAWQTARLGSGRTLVQIQPARQIRFKYSVSTAGNGQYPFKVSPSGWGSIPPRCTKHAPVAQLVEHMIEDHGRVGSTPTGCTKYASVAEMDQRETENLERLDRYQSLAPGG